MNSSTLAVDVSRLIAELDFVRHSPPEDEAARKALYEAIRGLSFSLETPGLSFQRIAYAVSLYLFTDCPFDVNQPMQLHMAQLANDIKLFDILVEQKDAPTTTSELAKHTKTNETFLGRILRYMASYSMVTEVSEDLWSASNVTRALNLPGLKAGISYIHDVNVPYIQAMTKVFAETNYVNPDDTVTTVFQRGHNTDLKYFDWLAEHPSHHKNFNLWMTAFHESQKSFLDVLPFDEMIGSHSKVDTPIFVDVAGGLGHQATAVRQKYPGLPGRIVLQDLAKVIAQAPPTEGLEIMEYDIWTEQTLKGTRPFMMIPYLFLISCALLGYSGAKLIPQTGARAYYFRNIFHDYPDPKCVTILSNTMAAMDEQSVILIDEVILPNKGVHWYAAQMDITMMLVLGALERTKKQWEALLEMARLKIEKTWTYGDELGNSILVCVKKWEDENSLK
ncbi:uncharacterized protein KY384_004814 [Bacidia gigantensis]|uniref:uncharacterized protein n=1 Tax=Bacidia gigantensis TaxID=2732470 RepID=UPI001D04894A|nr:uncharacterized protein KY384_004814 [Bacidia gigantensis]KAG8530312.1 hypothetical protein KY384_004814 [Bacidia gigantensis]